MNPSSPQNPDPWIDPDDAPEITSADLKRGVWAINGKIVSEAEGRVAFASRLKDIAEAENGTLSNNKQGKPINKGR
jgi:F420-0:gamma-glutamyl ligase